MPAKYEQLSIFCSRNASQQSRSRRTSKAETERSARLQGCNGGQPSQWAGRPESSLREYLLQDVSLILLVVSRQRTQIESNVTRNKLRQEIPLRKTLTISPKYIPMHNTVWGGNHISMRVFMHAFPSKRNKQHENMCCVALHWTMLLHSTHFLRQPHATNM